MNDTPAQVTAPGWYPNPLGRAPLRHWSGTAWTAWLASGATVWVDVDPARRVLGRGDLDALRFVEEIFLPAAREKAQLSAEQATKLVALVADLSVEAREAFTSPMVPAAHTQRAAGPASPELAKPLAHPEAVSAPPARRGRPAPFQPPTPAPPAAMGTPLGVSPAGYSARSPANAPARTRTTPEPAFREPSALSLWWSRAVAAARSDLAVHGIAYLGVLMLFVGMFGLVAFAFSEVTPGLRPVAELACAAVPFAAAHFLRRSGAEVVGRSLEVVGGLLLPLMVIASVVDGFQIPPDLHGGTLVVVLTVATTASAATYATWSLAHPASGVRYLVGPVLWLAAAMATLGVGRAVPTGEGVAVPTSAQVTAMSAALVLTLVAARLRPRARLTRPLLTAAVTGTIVLAILAILTGIAQGWPPLSATVTGLLVLAALELLRDRVPATVLDLAGPAWWATISLALIPVHSGAAQAAVAAAGFLALLELAGRRRRPPVALALPAAGLLLSLLAGSPDPWWAVGAFTVASTWAIARRTRPFEVPGSAGCLDAAAAALPAATILALTVATDVRTGLLGAATLTVLATVPATRRVLHRGPADSFWRHWWSGAVLAVTLGAQVTWFADLSDGAHWVVVGVFAALTGLCVVGPLRAGSRPWVVTALGAWAWVLACDVGGLPDAARGGLLAVAGLTLVVVGHGSLSASRTSLAMVGHATAIVAIALVEPGWGLVAAVASAAAGFLVTAAHDDRDLSPVGAALARAGGALRYLPWALAAISVPATVALGLDAGGMVALDDPWMSGVAAATALAYCAVARFGAGPVLAARPRLVTTMVAGGFGAALLAVADARGSWPMIVALSSLIGSVVLVPADRRVAVMRWIGWAALTPLAGLLAAQSLPWYAGLGPVTTTAVTLTAVGGVLLVGTAAVDLRGRPWTPRWAPARAACLPPALIGALEVGAGLLLTGPPLARPLAGLLTLTVAVVVLTTGALARAGSLAGLAAVLGWVATLRLAGPDLESRPWVAVLVTAGLLVLAEALHRRTADRSWWSRWDLPVLLAAGLPALTALAFAADGDQFVASFVLIGALCVAVAVRLHRAHTVRELVGWAGTLLILTGASAADGGWLALALLALSGAHTALAARATGTVRIARLALGAGAAIASWLAALAWFGWPAQTSLDVTAAGAGAGVLLVAVAARVLRADRVAVFVWGGAAGLVAAGAAVVSLWPQDLAAVAPSAWVVACGLLVAAGLCVAAEPVGLAWLRDAATVPLLGSVLVLFSVLDASSMVAASALAAMCSLLAGATLAGARRAPRSPWIRPGAELGAVAAVLAIGIGLAQPDGMILVPGTAAAAVWLAGVGVAYRHVGMQILSPVAACTSWVVFVANAVDGGPEWYTIAVGLTLLVIVSLWRRDQGTLGGDLASSPIVTLELVAVAFLVGASFVEALTVSITHALVAAALGVGVAGWGALTRVRRRVVLGAVVVLAAMVVLVAVPLVALLPAWSGASLWLLLAGVGLVAVLTATLLEKGRTAVRSTRGRLRDLTVGWE